MKESKLNAGWLAEVMAEAPSDYAMMFGPDQITVYGGPKAAVPLDVNDAGRLLSKMVDRYREWTGRDLASDLAAAPDPA